MDYHSQTKRASLHKLRKKNSVLVSLSKLEILETTSIRALKLKKENLPHRLLLKLCG